MRFSFRANKILIYDQNLHKSILTSRYYIDIMFSLAQKTMYYVFIIKILSIVLYVFHF